MTVTPTPLSGSTFRSNRRRGAWLVAVVTTPAATMAVWAIAKPFAGLDVRFATGAALRHVGALTVIFVSVVIAVAGWVARLVLERLGADKARRRWVAVEVVALAVSLAGPIAAGTTAATRIGLVCVHLAAAAVLIPALADISPRPGQAER